jgi:hypothetical protein
MLATIVLTGDFSPAPQLRDYIAETFVRCLLRAPNMLFYFRVRRLRKLQVFALANDAGRKSLLGLPPGPALRRSFRALCG